ncbi:MAG: lytic transglycosylase domain-containing protein [Synergistaceae bacterium]|nr:lytic transglycosylase domain-containing protein [Synergistaceae bacterium]
MPADSGVFVLAQECVKTALSPIRDFVATCEASSITADILLSNAADNVQTLSSFIRGQNRAISRQEGLLQASAFLKYSLKYGVPLDLLVAVAYTESHFNSSARSSAGAAGIMQVMWKIHSGLLQANGIMEEDDLYTPDKGIAAGALLISRYLRAYGDTQTALGRYYGGSPTVYWGRVSRNLAKVKNANLMASIN